MFARTCFICHRQSELRTCHVCFTINFCSDHSQEFYKYHIISKCRDLLINLNCKINLMNLHNRTDVISFCIPLDDIKSSSNTLDFIGMHVYPEDKIWTTKPWATDLLTFRDYYYYYYYYYSDIISNPLTLYYGMQDANLLHFLLKPLCVVHVIFPFYDFIKWLAIWEVFSHLLHNEVQEIIIIFLSSDITFKSLKLNTCDTCKSSERSITIQAYSLLYEIYVSKRNYRRPHIIVAFHGKHNTILTRERLAAIQNQDCPLLLTSVSLVEAERLRTCISDFLGVPSRIIKNRFGGLAPHQALDTGDIIYFNQYLIVCENLKNSNETTFQCSTSRDCTG